MSTNSVQKETTTNAKTLHNNHVSALVMRLSDYGPDPFSGATRDLSTGKEIDGSILRYSK